MGRLPRTVVTLGLVSLFTDFSSELIFPLLPAFLALHFARAPVILGVMEGFSEGVSAGLKWWSGRRADRAARLRPLVLAGYSISTVARPLMAFATVFWHPVAIRALDRVGKGIRSAPRDALIAAWVPSGERGRAFGFHRAMDHAGAAVGAAVAALLLFAGFSYERIFLLAALPGAVAVALLLLAREPEGRVVEGSAGRSNPPVPLPAPLRRAFVPIFLFALSNATDAFLLLKLSEQGARAELLPLAWLLLHLVKAAVSAPAGALSDRLGHARMLVAGWTLYAGSYAALALSPSWGWTLVVLCLYGFHHGLTEGAEKALVSELSADGSRGRAFGVYHAGVGVCALAAGALFGGLWSYGSSGAAFATAGGLALLAALLLARLRT